MLQETWPAMEAVRKGKNLMFPLLWDGDPDPDALKKTTGEAVPGSGQVARGSQGAPQLPEASVRIPEDLPLGSRRTVPLREPAAARSRTSIRARTYARALYPWPPDVRLDSCCNGARSPPGRH